MIRPKPKPIRRPGIKVFRDGREVCSSTRSGITEYKDRTYEMLKRQRFHDAITGELLHPVNATFDHEAGRGMGGGFRDDRIVTPDGKWQNAAISLTSNTLKGSKRYSWIEGKYVPVVKGEK